MNKELGKFIKVDLREFWKDEAREFTPWLAEPENLQLLSETVDMDLELLDIEKKVGPYRADIFARDINTEKNVIIENFLEKSDHDHLGKLITYASGLGANTVIWICKNFSDEHRQAVEWLNENTEEDINLFALEIELWKIDNSPVAPKFNIVASPNDWAKTAKEAGREGEVSETKLLEREFWSSLRDYFVQSKSFLKTRKPSPQHWYSFAIGRSGFHISLTVNTKESRLGCEVSLNNPENAKQAYKLLYEQKDAIERELSEGELEWLELPGGRESRIVLYREGNIKDRERWENYINWFKNIVEKFYTVFSPKIKELYLD
jgi:hypothetical protein